ncbi:MAG: capsid protein [Chloroflexi bacterium]|nr:capsid protein [Chloroflexota bacterium]
MTPPKIITPRGAIIQTKGGRAKLEWNTTFQRWQGNFSAAQRFVDSEVLRLSEPYIPLLTSMLIKSGILGTNIGSGVVEWIAPYAKAQYFSKRKPGSQTGPLRGPQWFERMKRVHRNRIVAGARRIAGRGGV